MKKHLYYLVGITVLIFAIGYLFSQYIAYKQFRLSQEKAIQDCVEKTIGTNTAGFIASNAKQKCVEKFSQ